MMIRVRVIPNASRSEVVGRIGSTVRVKVAAPAIGQKGKEKTVEIFGRPEEELEDVMETIP
jgi:uncharacterized protein YggU (UPF0235/DUF167 family)